MGAISKARKCKNQFISNIFLTPKNDGSYRMILNLKSLNKYILNKHFKLEDHKTVRRLITKNCFMATIDLKDAYFLVSVHKSFRKYLRFHFQGILYEFNCLPFGLNIAPRVFTKIMKPVLAHLRKLGFLSNVYLDDFLLIGNDFLSCQRNVSKTLDVLGKLGFLINYVKSKLIPKQECTYLGFNYNSKSFCISLPEDKCLRILKLLKQFHTRKHCKIRDFARFIGTSVSCCPAIPYGWLYTKLFEREKYKALVKSNDNFDSVMLLSSRLSEDFMWWKQHIRGENSLKPFRFKLEIFSDASSTGWGIFFKGQRSHGFWSPEEKSHHINYLELLAAFFGLECYAEVFSNSDILCRIDNTTAIACINRMGSTQYPKLNNITRDIWQWCAKRNIFIFASYIKSSDNKEADKESRSVNYENKFQLSQDVFTSIVNTFGQPDIDLFASRINKKCRKFVSWFSDPVCSAVDAFTIDWSKLNFYAFPPFSLMLKVLQKISSDKAEGIVVAPYWITQPWYPLFTSLLVQEPIFFTPRKDLLFFPDRSPHPLCGQITLVAGHLSGKIC